ncbi:calcium-binding tyrosine phosphorylation-regulated protein [Myotis myotis]|uniref:calcium-binding tyrosine phosphorylation-regulated protein n=1 Tax=Myotis myotis TaxID=51298 RepID=UPI00174AAE23|nr:calcium-binding tyrosine phosphorylation-regulated protein [Myotis myotis]
MFSTKPRLVVPYGLKTLLEGVSRAVLKTNPPNITQFAAFYFKELIVFREGNIPLDIKDLVRQFHQIKFEKWCEERTEEKKPEFIKEPGEAAAVPKEPTRVEKSTDTEEDHIFGPQLIHKTTQFPSVYAEQQPETEDTSKAVRPPKPCTPKTTPTSSPSPADVPPEFAYVPADPAQFAAQMLGNVSSTHSDQSDVLMVDVATSLPVFADEVLTSEVAEDTVVTTSVANSGERVAVQVASHSSVRVALGSKPTDDQAEPATAPSPPLQDEQDLPAFDQAPRGSWQAGTGGKATPHISSIFNDKPVIEAVTHMEQTSEEVVTAFSDHIVSLKEIEQSPPESAILVDKRVSGGPEKAEGSAELAPLEDANHPSVQVEAEATILISDTSLKGLLAQSLNPEGAAQAIGSQRSLHLEVEIIALVPGQEEDSAPPEEDSAPPEAEVRPVGSGEAAQAGQEEDSAPPEAEVRPVGSGEAAQTRQEEDSAPPEAEVRPVGSGEAAEAVHSGASVTPPGGVLSPAPEGLSGPEIEPEGEAAPAPGLMEPAIATSEAGQPPPYSNTWTLYCLTDMNQPSRPSPPPAPGPFPQATLYLPNAKDLQSPPKVTSPTYVMMDDSKKAGAPPFILVGANVQEAQDWKPLPGHTVVSQSDTLKRYATVQVPIAVPADQKFQKLPRHAQSASPPSSGQEGPRPQSPVFLSLAIPVEDVAKKCSGSGDKRTPFGSYGIAGEITLTTANVRRAEP